MRRRLIASVLLACAGAGCSAEQPGPPRLAPPSLAVTATGPAASAAQGRGAESGSLDLESFAPLLSAPSLSRATDAVEAGDLLLAAKEVRIAVDRGSPPPGLVPSFELLEARLLAEGGEQAGALAAFERAAKEPWALRGYAFAGAARAAVQLGRPREALDHLDRVPADLAVARALGVVRAEAWLLLGDRPKAIALLREVLDGERGAPSDGGLALRLGEELAELAASLGGETEPRRAAADEALGLARRVLGLAGGPAERLARASALEARALSLLPESNRAERKDRSPREEVDRLSALVDAKLYADAEAGAEALLARLGKARVATAEACEARVVLARALSGARVWGKGADVLGDVVRTCTDTELRARSLFLAGKYSDADKRYAQAIRHYQQLEKEQPGHRLADDARLRAAQSHLELGAEGKFTELLVRMPDDYPAGDMVLDGLFELGRHRMSKGDWSGAAGILERASALPTGSDASRGQELSGREPYFLARAWATTGDAERALATYEKIVREVPLSYYMLHAYTRLAEIDLPRARRVLAEATERAAASPFAFEAHPEFEQPGFRRALELLRVGDVEAARAELEACGVLRPGTAPSILWGVALLYERAGSARLSHALARGVLKDWLHRWPAGAWTRAWQIAFPRPFARLVEREARENAVFEPLVYAVMREESAFDPAAESPAKAYGLMQIIEPTARRFGKKIGLVGDAVSLLRPRVNVAIGCRVLADLTRSFPDNPLLAIPGYNAGPGRPKRWAGDRPDQDFDLWVEQIPFVETRRYTKRVLASRAAYAFLYAPEQAESTLRLPLRVLPE